MKWEALNRQAGLFTYKAIVNGKFVLLVMDTSHIGARPITMIDLGPPQEESDDNSADLSSE